MALEVSQDSNGSLQTFRPRKSPKTSEVSTGPPALRWDTIRQQRHLLRASINSSKTYSLHSPEPKLCTARVRGDFKHRAVHEKFLRPEDADHRRLDGTYSSSDSRSTRQLNSFQPSHEPARDCNSLTGNVFPATPNATLSPGTGKSSFVTSTWAGAPAQVSPKKG